MTDKLYLIDAMAFAFRGFYAIRAELTDSHGRPTNAVFGFTRILLKILREHDPAFIAVVFDAPGETFRDKLYAEYKATRRETPPALLEQFPRMHEVVEALNLCKLCVPGVEADDVIGTLARTAEAAGMESVIVSGDKDLLQLVSDKVRVFDPAKGDEGLWLGHGEVVERFGVGPERVIDALALIGDTADNVPGVRGIGDKTAKTLLQKYGTLENLYDHIDELKGKQKERLIEDRDQAFFSRNLVTVRVDVETDVTLEMCRRQAPDPARLREVFVDLAFNTLLEEMLPAPAAHETLDYRIAATEEDLRAAIAEMRAVPRFGLDTETTSTEPVRAELVGISMSAQPGKAWYIPVAHARDALCIRRDPDDLLSVEEIVPVPRERVIELLGPLFADPAAGKVGHNIKYDVIVLERAGAPVRGIAMDTMVASYLTDPSRFRHNLNEVSLQYLQRKMIPISDLIGRGSKAVTFDQVPVDQACEYACEDADIALRLAEVFEPLLKERRLEPLFREVELPLIHVLAAMEQRGIALDLEVFDALRAEIEARLGTLGREIVELAGESFNINSPKQLQDILFEKLGLQPRRKTKTGYSTDVDVLEELAFEHPLPGKVLEYRTLEKLRGTYVDALPRMINPETGRVHTSFNQAVAATGRLSSSDPNLQNIPVRTEIGRRIRAGFVPGSRDMRLISADYSQIELRILAHLSGDENLRQAFFDDEDIHRDTAARVFGVTPKEVTPDMRRQAKAVNFGVVYGISPFGLARQLGIAQQEAARFIDAYFRQYPRVRAWLDAVVKEAVKDGYVSTLLGRRRYMPELNSPDLNTRRGAERAAINAPVQGSAADIIKRAMVALEPELKPLGAYMLLQVHDELLVEAPEKKAGEAAEIMRRIMQEAATLEVPLKVDVGIGNNWAEAH